MGKVEKGKITWDGWEIHPDEVRGRLKELIRERTTLGAMAERMGWRQQRLRNKLNGAGDLDLEEILKLCVLMQIHPCEIFPGYDRFLARGMGITEMIDLAVERALEDRLENLTLAPRPKPRKKRVRGAPRPIRQSREVVVTG